jgi:hypothetical protein
LNDKNYASYSMKVKTDSDDQIHLRTSQKELNSEWKTHVKEYSKGESPNKEKMKLAGRERIKPKLVPVRTHGEMETQIKTLLLARLLFLQKKSPYLIGYNELQTVGEMLKSNLTEVF